MCNASSIQLQHVTITVLNMVTLFSAPILIKIIIFLGRDHHLWKGGKKPEKSQASQTCSANLRKLLHENVSPMQHSTRDKTGTHSSLLQQKTGHFPTMKTWTPRARTISSYVTINRTEVCKMLFQHPDKSIGRVVCGWVWGGGIRLHPTPTGTRVKSYQPTDRRELQSIWKVIYIIAV